MLLALDDLELASRYFDEAMMLAEHSGDLSVLAWVGFSAAQRDLRQGRADVARDRLVPLLDRVGRQGWNTPLLLATLAQAYLELDNVAAAGDAVAEALTRARSASFQFYRVDGLWVQAIVAIRQDHWSEAAQALEEGLALARSMPYPYAEARLLHVYGEMHVQKGEPEPARERLEAALAIFQRLGAHRDAERAEQAIAALQQ